MLALPTTTTSGRVFTFRSLFTFGTFLLTGSISQLTGVLGNYITYYVPSDGQECIYDLLEEDEYVTMSVFVSEGERLECTTNLEGPLAPKHVTEGGDLFHHALQFEAGNGNYAEYRTRGRPVKGYDDVGYNGNVRLSDFVSYEEMEMRHDFDDDDNDFDDRMMLDDVDDHVIIERRMQQKSRKMEKQTDKRTIEKRRIRENMERMFDGLPYERTVQVYAAGWYRLCVHAKISDVYVEIDMRKSSENGKPTNEFYGHVPVKEKEYDTYYDTKEVPEEIDAAEEKDLDKAKELLKDLHFTLNNIKNKQESQQHQNQLYGSINNHSHSRLRNSSMLETMIFFAVSAFQVYTIRKWFSGGPMLGR